MYCINLKKGNKYNWQMERQKLQLPSLYEPIKSSRISNFQDYAKWQKHKKQAYRDELRQQILQHDMSRQELMKQKQKDKVQANIIAMDEKHRRQFDKYSKIKTQQKYMAENISMVQHQITKVFHHQKRPNNPEEDFRQHPFIRLVDGQQKRKVETKNNFIFQNKLNDKQSQMKKQQSLKRKLFQFEQRKKFEQHVEEQYRKKKKDRETFQNKYLRIDKANNSDCKKQYLEYLKAQVNFNRSQHKRVSQVDNQQQLSRVSPGNIGMSPASYDRIKQLATIQKSLKMFPNSKSRNYSSFLQSDSREIVAKRPTYQKVLTQRAAPTIQNSSRIETLQSNTEKYVYPHIQSQFSERQQPNRLRKEYKQWNIINGGEKIFIK